MPRAMIAPTIVGRCNTPFAFRARRPAVVARFARRQKDGPKVTINGREVQLGTWQDVWKYAVKLLPPGWEVWALGIGAAGLIIAPALIFSIFLGMGLMVAMSAGAMAITFVLPFVLAGLILVTMMFSLPLGLGILPMTVGLASVAAKVATGLFFLLVGAFATNMLLLAPQQQQQQRQRATTTDDDYDDGELNTGTWYRAYNTTSSSKKGNARSKATTDIYDAEYEVVEDEEFQWQKRRAQRELDDFDDLLKKREEFLNDERNGN